jgi:hypothetical protein
MCHTPIAERRPTGTIGNDHRMLGTGHFYIVKRDVLHDSRGIDALLVAHADQVVKGDAGQGEDGRAVEVRIVEPVQEMDCARSSGSHAHSKPSSVLGDARRHESGGFLVPYTDVTDAVTPLAQCLDD